MKNFIITLLLITGALTCRAQVVDSLSVMPWPKSIKTGGSRFTFTSRFTIAINGPKTEMILDAANRFYQQAARRTHLYFPQEYLTAADKLPDAQLSINYKEAILPGIGMDESYLLTVSAERIVINAATEIGAMRALETLYQMIAADGSGYYCPAAEISDSPRFKWRGFMIDVARHFMPMDVLLRNIDAMGAVKMNVLHLHLSDDEGFRIESKVFPKLQQNGSNGLYYTQAEIVALVKYAHNRGIIVIPEFDLPGHCTSILAAYPFLASYQADYKPAKRYNMDTVKNINPSKIMKMISEGATPTINPAKESTYIFFDRLFKEMTSLFPDAYLHIGADENNGAAWKQNPEIISFMKGQHLKNTNELQAYFVKRMYTIAKKHHKQLISWEEAFNPAIPQDVIVQKWKQTAPSDKLISNIIQNKNQVVVSSGYYLDMYFPAYIHYLNDPVPDNVDPLAAVNGILGGEAAMWTELVNAENEEIRVWPRAAAIAERLWSPESKKDIGEMYRRLWKVDDELNDRGLNEQSNYNRLVSRWTNGGDITAVKTLTDLCVPVKGYRRLMGAMFSPHPVKKNLASPMFTIADVAHADSKPRLAFRNMVAEYLRSGNEKSRQQIKNQLQLWVNNRIGFKAACENSAYLQSISKLSDNLSSAAEVGLAALNKTGNHDEQLIVLKQLKIPVDEVTLSVLPEIEALITGKLVEDPLSYPMM
jgi:hexosaminidase